jgi:hypothetical protein
VAVRRVVIFEDDQFGREDLLDRRFDFEEVSFVL